MTNTSNSKTEFQWDDNVVKDFYNFCYNNVFKQPTYPEEMIEKFKGEKLKEAEEPKRIEVVGIYYLDKDCNYEFTTTEPIPAEKHEAVKKAIEWVLNNEVSDIPTLSSRDSKFWEEEFNKCKQSPFYYYKTYWKVNGGDATTLLSEEEFNKYFPPYFVKDKPPDTIQDKGWEIDSFKSNDWNNLILNKKEDGTFGSYSAKEIDLLYSSTHSIHSVKRLSDGEVFTVGDIVYFFGSKRPSPIERFEIHIFNKNHIAAYNGAYGTGIGVLRKVEKKLERPPLGLMPKNIWIEKRIEDIAQAIRRYIESSFHVPQEWIDEKEKLRKQLNNQ